MRKLLLIAGVFALAACGDNETASEAEPTTEAQPDPVAADTAVASWPAEAGTYEYTRSDGRAGVNTLAADGTYSNAMKDGTVETGKWANESARSCFVSDGGDNRCYTFTQPDAEGNFSGTMEGGITITLRKTA